MKTSNPTALGVFLVIGLALGVAGVLIFSSGTLFHPQQKSILYFDGSLKGLNPGAPVKFRGVAGDGEMSKTRGFPEVLVKIDKCRQIQRVGSMIQAPRSSGFFRYSCAASGRSFVTSPPWSRTSRTPKTSFNRPPWRCGRSSRPLIQRVRSRPGRADSP